MIVDSHAAVRWMMLEDASKSDWKVFREVREVALDRFCKRVADAFDDPRRSAMVMQLTAMHRCDLLESDELARFEKLVVLDAETGKVLATPAIGKGVDGAAFDATGGYVLASNGGGWDAGAEATLSVISTRDDKFEVVQTLPTASRARTLVLDPKTRRAYVPSAEYEAPKEAPEDAPKGARRHRPAMKPGTFKIIVVTP